MIIACCQTKNFISKARIILIFGLGLIGRYIFASLKLHNIVFFHEFPYSWNIKDARSNEVKNIVSYVIKLVETFKKSEKAFDLENINFIWSAGKGGFSMSQVELEHEMLAFKEVVDLSKEIQNSLPSIHCFFHMISSAGGLFEGQCNVNINTTPNPKRPYGILKLQQESYLLENTNITKIVYRPSSVYGFIGSNQRLGLIPTLIWNGYKYKVSNLYGKIDTLRDYVLASNIGRFVANKIFSQIDNSEIHILATGKSSTTFEIIKILEFILKRKLYIHYEISDENSAHNSYFKKILPEFWEPTSLETGIYQTYLDISNGVRSDILMDLRLKGIP